MRCFTISNFCLVLIVEDGMGAVLWVKQNIQGYGGTLPKLQLPGIALADIWPQW